MLLYSSEKFGCGATIKLDNGDTCMISVARSGVLIRTYGSGLAKILGSFLGAELYREKNVYRAAMTARRLHYSIPRVAELQFQNPVLTAFAQAVWHCSSAAEVAIKVSKAAESHGTIT
jgi:hypothetical protein